MAKRKVNVKKLRNRKNNSISKSESKFLEVTILDILNFLIALISCVIAFFAWSTSKQVEMDIVKYEHTLSQIPQVCILNQEFQIPFQFGDYGDKNEIGSYRGAIDFEHVSEQDMPIKIPISNIGLGLAQNCKVELNSLSQKKVALRCREIFQNYELYTHIAYDDKNLNLCYETYLKGYGYQIEGDNLVCIEWLSTNSIGEHYSYLDEDYISVYSYILPISEEKNVSYFEISEELSVFILEVIHQEMLLANESTLEPIELEISVSFQDLEGNEYFSKYLLKFSAASNAISILEPMIRMQLEVEKIE